jgi:FkbM family methyltransferase
MKIVRACGHTFILDWLNGSSTIVDLGLNRGSFSSRMSRLVGCRIYGAEPDPVMFERLPEIPGLSKLQAAVSGADGLVEFHVNSTQCSSMLFRQSTGQGGMTTSVRSVTLPTFLKINNLDRVDLLKADIEGAEVDMFENTPDELLQRVEQITVEFHDFMDPALGPGVARVRQRLGHLGFHEVDFSRNRMDVLYVNMRLHPLGVLAKLNLAETKYRRGVSRILGRLVGKQDLGDDGFDVESLFAGNP